MTRDSRAAAEGARVSAHVYYEGVAHECLSRCTAVEGFWKLSKRFLRQLQTHMSFQIESPGGAADALSLVKLICTRFHYVAKQIKDRRKGRSTLEIQDEYDVQDLLHSLLRIYFNDIRPEEWTPSYGGGASRMDFLLKSESIVVETKMTRYKLGDREVSDQLTIDAARYKTHPDCKTLVCFIYDPEGLIKNPRGVESDLANLSSPDLGVIAIITP